MEICPQQLVLLGALLVTLVLNFLDAVWAGGGTVYAKYPGYRLDSPCISGVSSAVSLILCVARCSQTSTCVSGSYKPSSALCCVSDKLLYHDGVTFVQDAESVYFQPKEDHAWHGTWALVFRAVAGNGQSVYTEYQNTGQYHDSPVGGASAAISCWSLFGSHSCSVDLRSSLLDSWAAGNLAVQRVKYSFYKDGTEVANIVFNGAGSNLTNWFQPSDIISSTYTDLTPTQTYNFFSFKGHDEGGVIRRFYASYSHNGCPDDYGWLVIVEQSTCAWETFLTPYPHFLYSPYSTYMHWDITTVGTADVMAIFVEL